MISVVILTKNNEETLEKVLSSLKLFPDVVIVDTGSTDKTLDIAKKHPNVSIEKTPFTGFGELRNTYAKKAKYDWILALDSDEVLSPDLQKEIFSLSLDAHTLYSFPFHNFFNGKHIKWCGWHPERHVRLYNRKTTSFSQDLIHEKILEKKLKIFLCQHPIYHYSYRHISDFLSKMQFYSSLFAQQNRGKKNSSFCKALFHGVGAFLKSYFLKRGFLGGPEGFIISSYQANCAFYKYLKLQEENKKQHT